MRQISEPDWKIFRQLHPVAVGRFCESVLAEAAKPKAQHSKSAHERYLDLFRLINERNKEMARLFDDFRRSTALLQLAAIKSAGWLTDEELLRFSQEAQEFVAAVLNGR
jgi:hypothetical protein